MIVLAHLLNDSSGSPRVLMATVSALKLHKQPAKLYVGSHGDGLLSGCGLHITRYWYRRSTYRLLTFFTYLMSQVLLLLALLRDRTIDCDATVYVNTLLPFGAAIYGRLTGRRVVYHIHEISVSPRPLRCFLLAVARWTSSMNIYVSQAHLVALPINGVASTVVYNSLDPEFVRNANRSTYCHRRRNFFNVLMVAALRDYKGIPEFLALAQLLLNEADVRFVLLTNDNQEFIDKYFSKMAIPENLVVHQCTSDTTPFYSDASLVMNLSRVDECVETFGMTILEAMAFGIPVIVPPVGGPAELIQSGVQGYLVDSTRCVELGSLVLHLAGSGELCERISVACRKRAQEFSFESYKNSIAQMLALPAHFDNV